jgi:hypothetical protein
MIQEVNPNWEKNEGQQRRCIQFLSPRYMAVTATVADTRSTPLASCTG